MPGWKKNIPICLQAEEQERGERGAARARRGLGSGPGPPPVPRSPQFPPEVSAGRRGRGAAPTRAAGEARQRRANSDFFFSGGGGGG